MHTLSEHAFHPAAVVELFTGHGQFGAGELLGQQIALLVDHGNLRLVQFRHTGCHQVDDGHYLTGFQRTARIQLDQYRGARPTLVTDEHRTFRNRQVHPRSFNVIQAGDSTRQFAFEATAITGGLHELTGAQALFFIENLKANIAVARRHTGSGEFQPGTGKVIGLDQQGAGVGLDVVGDIGSGQGVHDLLGVHAGQAAVQRPVVWLLRPEHHGKTNRHTRSKADQQAHLTQHGHLRDVFQE
ncbi:hypothetical protein D3C78_967100 [compost metagenome]